MKELAHLFAMMIMTNKKYVDPSKVLKSLTDGLGNPIRLGEQKDVTELNMHFLESIEEGLGEKELEVSPPSQNGTSSGHHRISSHSSIFDLDTAINGDRTKDSSTMQSTKSLLGDSDSIASNFLGSKVDTLYHFRVEEDECWTYEYCSRKKKQISERNERLGPIALDINVGPFYSALIQAMVCEIHDFKVSFLTNSTNRSKE